MFKIFMENVLRSGLYYGYTEDDITNETEKFI